MRPNQLTLFGLALPLALFGCRGGDPQPGEIDQQLHAAYGDMDQLDEPADFADPTFGETDLALADPDAADATLASDPTMQAVEADTATPARHVRVLMLWGRMRPQPAAADFTDWSGSIVAQNAAVRVLRLIAFEEPGDHIALPRPDIYTINFASRTAPSVDGVLLDVVIHPLLNPSLGPVTVTLNSPSVPFTQTITLAPGQPPAGHTAVGELGNGFAYLVFLPDHDGCAQGLMGGRWERLGKVDGRVVGLIRGRYISSDGALVGKIRGLYGERRDGAQVFFAKVIDLEGHFKGVLAGRYAAGQYAGFFLGLDRRIDGLARGRYFEGTPADGHGFWAGRWALRCGEAPAEGSTPPDDETAPPVTE